jgi:hypothetical protein
VTRDRGGGDHVERVDPGSLRTSVHGDAHGLVSLVQPAGGQAVTLGAEQQRGPLPHRSLADRRGAPIGGQRQQPESFGAQLGQAVVPLGHAGVGNGEHGAHRDLDRTPVERVGAPRRQDHRVHAERGGAAEDRPDVAVVDEVLEHEHATGAGGQFGGRGERLAAQ